jgi:hypothetical protein
MFFDGGCQRRCSSAAEHSQGGDRRREPDTKFAKWHRNDFFLVVGERREIPVEKSQV